MTGWDNRWWRQSCNGSIPSITKNNSSFTPDTRLKSAVMNDSVNQDRRGLSDTRAGSPHDRQRCRDQRAPTPWVKVFDGEGRWMNRFSGDSFPSQRLSAVCLPNLLLQDNKKGPAATERGEELENWNLMATSTKWFFGFYARKSEQTAPKTELPIRRVKVKVKRSRAAPDSFEDSFEYISIIPSIISSVYV